MSEDQLRLALQRLLDKLDVISKDKCYQGIFMMAYVHGMSYTGPTWADEYEAGRKALTESSNG